MILGKCFFTGHRIMSNDEKERVFDVMKDLIRTLEKDGIYEFYTGGAIGFDYVAALAVLTVREELPHLCLELCLPCYGSEKKWTDMEKFNFQLLKVQCDRYTYISEEPYFEGCMQKRNEAMADLCGTCVAYCKNPKSGTKKTMDYAKKVGCRVINIADEN